MKREERYLQVAELHANGIDQGFLATLGIPFLRLMYQAIDEAPGSFLIVDQHAGRVRGFVSGAKGMGPIYRRMLRRPWRLCAALLPSLGDARRIKRIFEILRYDGTVVDEKPLPPAELLSIAVSPDCRGKGIAESLYTQLKARFRADGVNAFRIVVGEALTPAHRFYQRMGAIRSGKIEVHAGDSSWIYVQGTQDTLDESA